MTDTKHETKQNASHTPGPWTLEDEPYDSYRDIYGWHGETVASVEAWDGEGSEAAPEAAANARLIAAAPALLEALDYLLEQTVDQDLKYGIALTEGEEDARVKALTAIAQAKGMAV